VAPRLKEQVVLVIHQLLHRLGAQRPRQQAQQLGHALHSGNGLCGSYKGLAWVLTAACLCTPVHARHASMWQPTCVTRRSSAAVTLRALTHLHRTCSRWCVLLQSVKQTHTSPHIWTWGCPPAHSSPAPPPLPNIVCCYQPMSACMLNAAVADRSCLMLGSPLACRPGWLPLRLAHAPHGWSAVAPPRLRCRACAPAR
jgi:hypothetical protein